MIRLLFLACLLVLPWGTYAQRGFNGLWVGTLVQGAETYEIRLKLEKDGRRIAGSSLIVLSDTTYMELRVKGYWHEDRSMNIYEIDVLYPENDSADVNHFQRTYQLLYRREFNDYYLEGWWQEMEKSATDETRRFGHLRLEKLDLDSKA